MKTLNLYIVLVESERTGNRFYYHEEGFSAQEAVDKVREYIDDYQKIVFVFRQDENWR